ncbi:uncharacterized protein LOC144448990 [Glandiceps talaboti]
MEHTCISMVENSAASHGIVSFSSAKTHDVTIVIANWHFQVHKKVLSDHSHYFKTLFSADFLERGKKEIELRCIPTAEAFHILLDFMYREKLNVSPSIIEEVLIGAEFLQILDGVQKLICRIYPFISAVTWNAYLETSAQLDDRFQRHLTDLVHEWMIDHYHLLWNTSTFLHFDQAFQNKIKFGPYKSKKVATLCSITSGDINSKKNTIVDVQLKLWKKQSSEWSFQTSVPNHFLQDLQGPLRIFALRDTMYVLWPDQTGQVKNANQRHADAFLNTANMFEMYHAVMEDFVKVRLDRMLCYNIRRNDWRLIHPTTSMKVINAYPSSTYPLKVLCNGQLHLIGPKGHFAFCPVENRWRELQPITFPDEVEILDPDSVFYSKGFITCATACKGKIFVFGVEKWFDTVVSWQLFACDKGYYYTMYDPATDTWCKAESVDVDSSDDSLIQKQFALSCKGYFVCVTCTERDGGTGTREILCVDTRENKVLTNSCLATIRNESKKDFMYGGKDVYAFDKICGCNGSETESDVDQREVERQPVNELETYQRTVEGDQSSDCLVVGPCTEKCTINEVENTGILVSDDTDKRTRKRIVVKLLVPLCHLRQSE